MNSKKYILKPGKHQFAPGEHARYDNDNLTDAEAEWYLERYPHIKKLFVARLESLNIKRRRAKKASGQSIKPIEGQPSNITAINTTI